VDGRGMNRLITHISKTLALLAILLLPVQQSLAAGCCGNGVQESRTNQTSADSSKSNCSQHDEASCCRKESGLGRSCCEWDSPNSKSELGQCLDMCHDNVPSGEAGSAMVGSTLENDPPVAAVQSISTIFCDSATQDSLANTIATNSASGFQRCVQLCRYRL